MKKNYLKNLYLSQLHSKKLLQSPLEIFKSSLGKLEDIEFLNEVLKILPRNEFEEFLVILKDTCYIEMCKMKDNHKNGITELLFKYPITERIYSIVKSLNIKLNEQDLKKILDDGLILNYCSIKESIRNVNKIEISEITLKKLNKESFEQKKYFSIVKNLLFDLKQQLNKNINDYGIIETLEYLKKNMKEPLFIAILDNNGRVNSLEYSTDDLLLINQFQIYNLKEKQSILLNLCQVNSEDGFCRLCKRRSLFNSISNNINNSCNDLLTTNNQIMTDQTSIDQNKLVKCLENSLIQNDITTAYRILKHRSDLRISKYLRMILKQYISNNNDDVSMIKLVSLFKMENENETIAISFFKGSTGSTSNNGYLKKTIRLLPYLLKTKKLCFAGFIVLMNLYKRENLFEKMVVKNLIYRFNNEFEEVLDLILEYIKNINKTDSLSDENMNVSVESVNKIYGSNREDENKMDISDMNYLAVELKPIAGMFSLSTESFISKYIYYIFNTFYPSPYFTQSFINQNIKYYVIQRIIDQSYKEQIDDVDVLVGLLFLNNNNINMNIYFKPNVSLFIKKNLSHILFKIKSVYINKTYGRKTCIYKIMKYVLEQININLYFNYTWPYIEFILNHDNGLCGCNNKNFDSCSGYFIEWLKTFNNNPKMCPYLIVPFENVEDLPNNSENKIYEMLNKYFKWENSSNDGIKSVCNNEMKSVCNNNELLSVYKSLTDLIPNYNPNNNDIKDDMFFISKFIHFYSNSKPFRLKILSLNPSNLPLKDKSLFGDLKYKKEEEFFLKAPNDIPGYILKNYLLKNYLLLKRQDLQDLFSFTIQEFLKEINSMNGNFNLIDGDEFLEQFKHTKFHYKFNIKHHNQIITTNFRSFLESLFSILYSKTKKYQFMKYLVLFDDPTVEFACLSFIKIITDDETISNENSLFLKDLLNNIDVVNINDDTLEILKFILKINTFVNGKRIIKKEKCIEYAMKVKDYYTLIYYLDTCIDNDMNESDNSNIDGEIKRVDTNDVINANGSINTNTSVNTMMDVLQISYFMINDLVRVKGFNGVSNFINENYNDTKLNLFFDFIIDKNYKAAQEIYNSINFNIKNEFINKMIKEILDSKIEIESILLGKDEGVLLHIIKDIELLFYEMNYKNENSIDVIKLISERRRMTFKTEKILKMQKYVIEKLFDNRSIYQYNSNVINEFAKSVDLELISLLINKKEYQKAEEEIAKMILKEEYSVFIEHARIKIEQKNFNEAKQLLKKAKLHCRKETEAYFKATVKLCEITQSKSRFEEGIEELERIYTKLIGDCKSDVNEITSSSNKISIDSQRNSIDSQLRINHINSGHENIKILYDQLQKLYFLTAKYFEKHDSIISIKYYFKSFISNHESIPRFFHLISNVNKSHIKIIGEMIEIIKKEYLCNLIPFYNQISTKISVDNSNGVLKFYKEIITAMLEKYPYQTHWNTLFLYNSKKPEIFKIIFEIIENLNLDCKRLFMDIKNCSEKLTNIAKKNSQKLTMEDFPEIRNLFPLKINVPGQLTEINNIRNEILIFKSLQMPKKIVFIGENGIEYPLIVKFKDDLRKDSRFMDLNGFINKLFDSNNNINMDGCDISSQNTTINNNYYIRKYNVIPFNHESGIIEFINDLTNLKSIVSKYLEIKNESLHKFIKTKMIGFNNMKSVMKRYPPVFNRYLKESYMDPYQFYINRENYIKTYAIMNIVGWFMGLGDRHCENIHFDTKTGDTVHVDLNCIFDKGKSLEIPEKVPFRLTQNIVDGFGILKFEGTYKNTMKYTLEILQNNRDVIQANLLSFVFDPLFEWARKKAEPIKILEGMDKKLDFEDVDFKIEELINEATDLNNLGSMYIGWMSFI